MRLIVLSVLSRTAFSQIKGFIGLMETDLH